MRGGMLLPMDYGSLTQEHLVALARLHSDVRFPGKCRGVALQHQAAKPMIRLALLAARVAEALDEGMPSFPLALVGLGDCV